MRIHGNKSPRNSIGMWCLSKCLIPPSLLHPCTPPSPTPHHNLHDFVNNQMLLLIDFSGEVGLGGLEKPESACWENRSEWVMGILAEIGGTPGTALEGIRASVSGLTLTSHFRRGPCLLLVRNRRWGAWITFLHSYFLRSLPGLGI